MISSPRTITTSSIMLTTTQTWLGTMRTTSPTLGRVLLRVEVEKAVLLGEARDLGFGMFEDQAVAVEPPPVSDVSVFDPASRMPRSGPARLTTVE